MIACACVRVCVRAYVCITYMVVGSSIPTDIVAKYATRRGFLSIVAPDAQEHIPHSSSLRNDCLK